MTKQLKWRLGKLPTPDEVLKLVNDKLITKEEARDILFSETENHKCEIDGTEWVGDIKQCPTCQDKAETDKRSKESLEDEIKFLRELVQKLSNNNSSRIVEVIREVHKPYATWDWYRPYQVWCSSSGITGGGGTTTTYASALNNAVNTAYQTSGGTGLQASSGTGITNFSSIKTF